MCMRHKSFCDNFQGGASTRPFVSPTFLFIVESLSRGTGKPQYQCIYRELAHVLLSHVLLSHKLSQRPCSRTSSNSWESAAAPTVDAAQPVAEARLSRKQHFSHRMLRLPRSIRRRFWLESRRTLWLQPRGWCWTTGRSSKRE